MCNISKIFIIAFLAHKYVYARFLHHSFWLLASPDLSDPNCKDGVCSIPNSNHSKTANDILNEWEKSNNKKVKKTSDSRVEEALNSEKTTKEVKEESEVKNNTVDPTNFSDLVTELEKLGWNKDEAKSALRNSQYDISKAAEYLDNESQINDERKSIAAKFSKDGFWTEEAGYAALKESNWNLTEAQILLESEESKIQEHFQNSVSTMVSQGWDEYVARQSLLLQWTIDQQREAGKNVTTPREVLDKIKPSLRRSNETNSKSSSSKKPKDEGGSQTKPAKKEDCVFDVTSFNFQKVVLDSPVPVILDIYADWCGPCKQLGPVLENAAIKSGGMFRLAKVNSDNERSISELLGVTGLPTVFSVKDGEFSDKFVGMLPQEELQQFLVRSVTGFGDRVQAETSEAELKEVTGKVGQFAGLASLSFKNKEKLLNLVEDALQLEGAFNSDYSYTDALKSTLLYLTNAQKNIRVKKYRTIKTSSKIFKDVVSNSPSCLKILEVAGFKENSTNSSEPSLELIHKNPAILLLVVQKVSDFVNKKKFSAMQPKASGETSGLPTKKAPHTQLKKKETDDKVVVEKEEDKKKKKVVAKTTADNFDTPSKVKESKKSGFTMSLRLSDGTGITKHFERNSEESLESIMSKIVKDSVDEKWLEFDVKRPLPRRIIKKSSSEMKSSLVDLFEGKDFSIDILNPDKYSNISSKQIKTKSESEFESESKSKSKSKSNLKLKTNTLQTTGHFTKSDEVKKKRNEYFGGDSTVVLSGDEEDEEEDDEEEEEGEEEKE